MRNQIYYALKPFLPSRLRLALRRIRARHILKRSSQFWPICEATGRAPENWPGWPGGKEFAFVLSHDVEGIDGVNRCRQLAEIEMEHGFRSSFNFVPRGSYQVPADLLEWLGKNGFEVGVHDLHHDGTLFRSRPCFERDAALINGHLREWGAVGFRAGFMLHKLDWFHALNVEYDSSTFDVDPFEPQPDGVQTVFPFWVPRPDRDAGAMDGGSIANQTLGDPSASGCPESADLTSAGYLEIPYTLVQDYNLFVVMQQTDTEIWRRKLRWLAEKGAMAMLNTHPDYMTMPGRPPGAHEYPVELYGDFLEHVKQAYAHRLWPALPREVAAYCRAFRPVQARPPRHVTMVTYSDYRSDHHVRGCAEALAQRGDAVRVLCLGIGKDGLPGRWEDINGVEIRCLQPAIGSEAGFWARASHRARFVGRILLNLGKVFLPGQGELLQVHRFASFLVFALCKLALRETAIVLDSRTMALGPNKDPAAGEENASLAAAPHWTEKWSDSFADRILVAGSQLKEPSIERSAIPAKVAVLPDDGDPKKLRDAYLSVIDRLTMTATPRFHSREPGAPRS